MEALQTFFDMSADLLCVAGLDGYFKRVNPAFRRTLGYHDDDLKTQPFVDFVHPDDRASTRHEIEKLSRGEHTLKFENRYRCKDGNYKWLAWTAVPDLKVGLLYAVARDITDSKRSLDELMNDLPGMVYRCRNNRRWIMEFVSEGCRVLTGHGQEAFLDREAPLAYGDLIHADDRERVWTEVQTAIAENREFEIEYRLRTRDGQHRSVWERGRAIVGTENNALLQGFVTDITESRRLRDELIQMQKMESLGQLTSGIAHDFNNLLSVVLGNMELLEESIDTNGEAGVFLRDAMESAWRGADLSQRLLAFSKRQMLAPEVISVTELIAGMESLLRRTLGEAIEIETVLPANPPPVLVDRGQLENAILNLAINARDAMPDGGLLRISVGRFKADKEYSASRPDTHPGRYVEIDVSDNGTGMLPETQRRAFEPFFTTKEKHKGTGLGLSMVYGFLRQSGGHSRIYSEFGHGTSIKLYLPEADAAEPTVTIRTLGLMRDCHGRKEQILVVEDDPNVRKMVIRVLKDLNYVTFEAEHAVGGLQLLRQHGDEIDLLFTDVVMRGGMSGIELAELTVSRHPGIKVLLTSGFSEQHVAGGITYPLLNKPYRKLQLAQAVRSALGPYRDDSL
jgi:PAS domain S-box-containing protein